MWTRRHLAFALLLLPGAAGGGLSAAEPDQARFLPAPSEKGVIGRLVRLRMAFIRRLTGEGYKPSLPPPQIVLGTSSSFGEYDLQTNVIHITSWSALASDERQEFADFLKGSDTSATVQSLFEDDTYRWAFIEEMAHWWQACQHKSRRNSYAENLGANRITYAFWRKEDPQFLARMLERFHRLAQSLRNPVPPGISKVQYFDTHFEALTGAGARYWFLSDMVADIAAATPTLSFHRALSQPLYPA